MKRILNIIIVLLSAALVFACQKPYETKIELGVSNEEIVLPEPAGGHCYITVYSNTQWTIALEPVVDWATLDKDSGEGIGYVRMDYEDNASLLGRSVEVVVRTGSKECRIVVNQPSL